MNYEYQYSVDNNNTKFKLIYKLSTPFHVPHLTVLAEKCAEDYFYNHDGWESRSWPKFFTIFDGENNEIGKFDVDMEPIPHFTAFKIN